MYRHRHGRLNPENHRAFPTKRVVMWGAGVLAADTRFLYPHKVFGSVIVPPLTSPTVTFPPTGNTNPITALTASQQDIESGLLDQHNQPGIRGIRPVHFC